MTGELDLGMARPPLKRPGLDSRPLLHEQLVAALPEAHPLAGRAGSSRSTTSTARTSSCTRRCRHGISTNC